ncbi:MAG: hypothetical protein EOM80_19035 [Erysipelotrichia bacterium]|nr:hypothetical protein [Erysipelotrichia bacterium]
MTIKQHNQDDMETINKIRECENLSTEIIARLRAAKAEQGEIWHIEKLNIDLDRDGLRKSKENLDRRDAETQKQKESWKQSNRPRTPEELQRDIIAIRASKKKNH